MRIRGRDTFETLCKENWQGAVSRWIWKLRNKKQKEEPGFLEISAVAQNTCSGAGMANFHKGPESKCEEAFTDRGVALVTTQLCPPEHKGSPGQHVNDGCGSDPVILYRQEGGVGGLCSPVHSLQTPTWQLGHTASGPGPSTPSLCTLASSAVCRRRLTEVR